MFRALPLVLLVALSGALPAWGKGEPAPSGQGVESWPSTPEDWLARMLDAGRNGLALKDPGAFVAWLDALSEPRFMTALATVALEPGTYPKVLGRMIDPSAARNWAEFTDPNLYLRWMLAGLDSRFYTAIYNRLGDPGKLRRWASYASGPEAYAPLAQAADPATADKWAKALTQAGNYEPLLRMTHPATALSWMAAFAERFGKPAADHRDGKWLRLPDTTVGQPFPPHRY